MAQASRRTDPPKTPARRTKTAHEPDTRGKMPPKAATPERPAKPAPLTEDELVRLAYHFYAYHEWMIYLSQSVDQPSPLRARFDQHLGAGASELPVLAETFEPYDHVNVQRAIDRYLARPGRTHEVVGVAGGRSMSLSDLIASKQRSGLQVGPVEHVNLASGPDSVESCVQVGLYFISDGGTPSILLVRGPDLSCGRQDLALEVVSTTPESASALLANIRNGIGERNVFRKQVIAFADTNIGWMASGPMVFWHRPNVRPAQLVLPEGLLEVIERQVFGIAEHGDELKKAGHHMKRGLLLHGPPGTGKTHTVRYLLGRAKTHTVIVLTGAAMRFVRQACALARLLQPSIVVLEDVDLVARHREYDESGNPILFDVLNQLDGISDDADIVFVLTTNRADLLEPALAARPGRVDLAVEIPLPGDDERRRLLRLYGKGMKISTDTEDEVIRRTAGVTASFLRELARKAALLASIGGSANGKVAVRDGHVTDALTELLADRSALTRALLGGHERDQETSFSGSGWL